LERTAAEAFERAVAPHLGAVWNLARWLVRDDRDAEDAVQEALLKAFRFWPGFSGGNLRGWLLAVVRNSCFTLLAKRQAAATGPLEGPHGQEQAQADEAVAVRQPGPEAELLRAETGARIAEALGALPLEFREVFLLREVEGLSYKEIADAAAVPIGTVMSRLSRARALLRRMLAASRPEGVAL
jgi:RNA polymerase sigma-70 factor (ECF subfamily)